MISELSAGCACRLFGTGLAMSENASDCTQNAAYWDRKLKKNLWGGGTARPPPLGRGHCSQNPTSSAPWSLAPRLDLLPLHFHPPLSHTSGYGPGVGWVGHVSTGWAESSVYRVGRLSKLKVSKFYTTTTANKQLSQCQVTRCAENALTLNITITT